MVLISIGSDSIHFTQLNCFSQRYGCIHNYISRCIYNLYARCWSNCDICIWPMINVNICSNTLIIQTYWAESIASIVLLIIFSTLGFFIKTASTFLSFLIQSFEQMQPRYPVDIHQCCIGFFGTYIIPNL